MPALRTALAGAGALALLAVGAPPAQAAEQYQVSLDPLNDSGVSGTALITVDGQELTVRVSATGYVPNSPHAQHLHGDDDLSMDFMCPTTDRDADGNGITTTTEAVPDYGDIFISLTTSGDTSAGSGLAVDRMPVADAQGRLEYERTITVDAAAVAAIRNLHLVQHGIDVNGNGTYDFDAGPSDLDPALPEEATAPATCGMIEGSSVKTVPAGGVQTGGEPGTGVERPGLLVGGAGAVVVGGLLARRRRHRQA
jgi:MYXO-CTERM domain-containing protein